jgi:two-component system sensor histidine kinase TctE
LSEAVYGKPFPALIEVAETLNARTGARKELFLTLAGLEFSIIVTAAVLLWFAVHRGLEPLIELGREIDGRQAGTATGLRPLKLEAIPSEARPPVRAMNDLLARLDAAIQVIRNFIADASHQMKTPLASLRVHVTLLRREADESPGTSETIGEIERSTSQLDRLVGQLLTMARAEQALVKAEEPGEELADLVIVGKEAVSSMVPFAAAKNVELAFQANVDTAKLLVNSSMLHDILTNLIDNSIRYNNEGGSVLVSIDLDKDRVNVSVADDGPGISPEYRERVFDRFYRIPGAGRPAGSGLGLSIVQSLVRRNAGTVTLSEGIDGRGLCITVGFPDAIYRERSHGLHSA